MGNKNRRKVMIVTRKSNFQSSLSRNMLTLAEPNTILQQIPFIKLDVLHNT